MVVGRLLSSVRACDWSAKLRVSCSRGAVLDDALRLDPLSTIPPPVPSHRISTHAHFPIAHTHTHQTPNMDDPDSTASSLLTRLTLDLRGQRFSIERETLMNLPESVLLCLFPNGLVLSRQSQQQQYDAQSDDEEDDEEVYLVDVSCGAGAARGQG